MSLQNVWRKRDFIGSYLRYSADFFVQIQFIYKHLAYNLFNMSVMLKRIITEKKIICLAAILDRRFFVFIMLTTEHRCPISIFFIYLRYL